MNLFRKDTHKTGLPPGTLTAPYVKSIEKPVLTLFQYDSETLLETEIDPTQLNAFEKGTKVYWLNIDGLSDTDILRDLGNNYSIHDLSLEDILNTDHRPKIEEHDTYILLIVKMIYYNTSNNEIEVEQVSLVLLDNILITFQEKPGDVFTTTRERLRENKGRVRKRSADYLAYSLFDAIVDNYYIVFEQLGEKITACENEIIKNPTPSTAAKIHALRNTLILLRRSIWPLREVVNALNRNESNHFNEETKIYFGDLYDHTVHIIEAMETYREMLSGLRDGYQNAVSNKMNEIMKILTIISTFFIPLTFLAGLYGMNFKHMPELEWQGGYPTLLGIMAVIVVILLFFFRKKKWI